ncbi:aldo/keto reductase [Novosphingobium sp. PASSN1]|uniref:aldo/keto reductase n=1 Tax=Novosphingobium sp. PASSN1 TaxID=2015561 RepID=UPI000BCA8787|nr:aldo/keto reductase [Novosphingobium sp. PASSN1]OYU33762.1 MAG: aldo/keto reductase [Novosphingobium sp. PASSN1]
MNRIALRHAAFDLPAIGLGCMGMSEFYGPTDDELSLSVMARSVELGANLLDTADMYGRGSNEELLSQYLKNHRAQVILATKCGLVRGETPAQQSRDTSPNYIRAACEASLRRLKVDTIDLYYLHRLDGVTPIEDSMGELSRLHEAGKIRAVGLSEVSPKSLLRAHEVFPVSAVQSEYSLATRGGEVEAVIDLCGEIGAAFVAYSPLSRGLLTGAYRSKADLIGLDFRFVLPRFEEVALIANLTLVDALGKIAASKGASSAQVAISWVLHRAPHMAAIPGTRSLKRLEENIGSTTLALSMTDLELIAEALPVDAFQGERYPAFLASKPE